MKKMSDVVVRGEYQIKIAKRFPNLEKLRDSGDIYMCIVFE